MDWSSLLPYMPFGNLASGAQNLMGGAENLGSALLGPETLAAQAAQMASTGVSPPPMPYPPGRSEASTSLAGGADPFQPIQAPPTVPMPAPRPAPMNVAPSVPLPAPRPAEAPQGGPEDQTRDLPMTDRFLSALKGVKVPEAPAMQKISTPAAPKPTAIKGGELMALLQILQGGADQNAGLKLPNTLGQALR